MKQTSIESGAILKRNNIKIEMKLQNMKSLHEGFEDVEVKNIQLKNHEDVPMGTKLTWLSMQISDIIHKKPQITMVDGLWTESTKVRKKLDLCLALENEGGERSR